MKVAKYVLCAVMAGRAATATCQLPAAGSLKASSFGWDAANATKCLQAALDSGAAKVVVDRQAGDWVVEPLFLRSGQEVVIEDGVVVRALKGAYKGRGDCLFRAVGVSNVVLRGEGVATLAMNKTDYQNPDEYSLGEWRHTVSIVGGHDITVRDLTLLSSGGDGVYVRSAARNVLLDNLVCRDHHRQGISVISAVDLLVRRCRFAETAGTAPQCGLDIEPNVSKDRLENVVFEDCAFEGNASTGILLHLLPLDETSRPISIVFRRCVSRGNRYCGIKINCARQSQGAVRGSVTFEDCTTSGNKTQALAVCAKRSDALDISFKNCTFDAREGEAVLFSNGRYFADFGGIAFDNVRIVPGKGKPLSFEDARATGIDADTMKGTATIVKPDGEESVSLNDFARAYPPNPELLRAFLSFKAEMPDFRSLKVSADVKPLAKPVSTGWLRKRFTFVQQIPGAGDYPVVFRMRPLGKRRGAAKVQVLDAAGTDLGTFSLKDGAVTNVIHATGAGMRRFEVTAMSGLAAVESAWPGQGLQADGAVHLLGGRNRQFWFAVPATADKVCVQVTPEEPCSARLLRPDGSVAAEMPLGTGMTILESKREKSASGEVWCLDFPRINEDVEFRIGSPALPLASPSPQAVLGMQKPATLEIGWGEADITPPPTKRIPLCGQYYQRLADKDNSYHSRLKFVALAMKQGNEHVLMGAIDNVTVWQPFTDRVRARVKELVPEIAPERIFMGSIHTHSAPAIRPSGTQKAIEMERKQPDVWGPNEYSDFALDLVAKAYVAAWRGRKPGGICRAFGHARVGHCRLARYADGSTEMYGDTNRPDFVGMLEGEDDGVEMLFTTDAAGRKTGLVLNVACPSQVMEANYQVSSDFAGATREKLKGVYGGDFHMLYQIGAAGCQSPRDLVRRDRTEPDGWHDDMVQLLSDRLVKCVKDARPGPVSTDAVLKYENCSVKLPMRRVTPAQVAAAKKELEELQRKWPDNSAWDDFLAQVHAKEKKDGPGPYDSKLHPYAVMQVDKAVLKRAAEQDEVKELDIEMHVTRIGDVAMVTCPFELYLAYGQVIKARSAAAQTFVVTKCGSSGYLPTQTSENSVGYSGGINVGKIGHEGGCRLCDIAVERINAMFKN